MLVSVVVPVFNAESTLQGCLDALLDQDFPGEQYEVIVVDNGSRDGTWSLLERYSPRIRRLQETQVRGSYAARNAGIRASKGSIIAFTDGDCVPDRRWLSLLVEGFNDPEVGCVGGEILALAPATSAERYAEAKGILRQKQTLKNSYRPFFQTANVAYRCEVFHDIGLFEHSLESGGDADLCWRLQEQTSWKLRFQEAATVLHHHRTSWRELWKQFERYGRGRASLQVLHPDYPAASFGFPNESLRLLVKLGVHASRYGISTLLSPVLGDTNREPLEFSFYSLVTQAAFMLGKHRGPRQKVTRTLYATWVEG